MEDLHAHIDDPALPVTPDSVLMLRGCGPKGYPGMPVVANLLLPRKMLQMGIRDMVRVCDGRMSGTAQLNVPEEELFRRTPAPTATQALASPTRGWERLYVDHVQQADIGADLDFLVGATGPVVARESH